MVSYTIYYTTKKQPNERKSVSVDAKNLKSAKSKIEKKLAKIHNKFLPPYKQVKSIKIDILDYSINGYY